MLHAPSERMRLVPAVMALPILDRRAVTVQCCVCQLVPTAAWILRCICCTRVLPAVHLYVAFRVPCFCTFDILHWLSHQSRLLPI